MRILHISLVILLFLVIISLREKEAYKRRAHAATSPTPLPGE
jgi:hypothetical protein